MSRAPVERADFETLELEESYIKTGAGTGLDVDRAGLSFGLPPLLDEAVQSARLGIDFISVALPLEMKPPVVPGWSMAGYVSRRACHRLRSRSDGRGPEHARRRICGVDRRSGRGRDRALSEGGALGEIVLTELV